MHLNSRAENIPLSLNFMGRKLRNHTVAPAAKQRAWDRTSPSRCADENRGGLSRVMRTQPLVCVQNELPGSIQELREEVQRQPCNVHNTHLDQENNGEMNIESSRSHLIISIMLESRNLANGSMTYGKLNLVDLAGSERAAKTGAKDDQLKEANSINKSLSALGDVISALALEQAHVPYRNNKLTQLMQDSLGGNAKTLMFLNISPSDCNLDETLTSLIYASRVKAITNHAQRNMESKEITQLKEVILRLKSGQTVEEEDV
ncbi:uncharacterized protein si:dkey-96l17.6 [Hemibagrus wyckioides]|uniref:uncharacterized protein si:dkey-96l17.6 n=1 Tax=Hemibagrus wyckioides TaxID=337641 RepID=UPI00266C3EF4|nr:uncharacterized protein si:dkey-96l17.6 [Hemibagrus wyckioides]